MQIFFQELRNGYTVVYDEFMVECGFDSKRIPHMVSLVDKYNEQLDVYIHHPKLDSKCHNAHRRVCVIIKSELIFVVNAKSSEDRFWQYDFLLHCIENEYTIRNII